jgi:hypothetical protein
MALHTISPRTTGVWLPFFNKTMLAHCHRSRNSSGYTKLALRQPVICFPIPSINLLNSACYLIESIFISTQRRISNFNSSKSSKNASRYATLSFALLALYILFSSCMLSRFISCPRLCFYSCGKSLVYSKIFKMRVYTSLNTGKS